LAGAGYLFKGFRLIRQPGIRRFVFIPLVINVMVFTALTWGGYYAFNSLMITLLPASESFWYELLRGVLWLLYAGVIVVVLFFSFTIVANLIGAPFNGVLAERIEQRLVAASTDISGLGVITSLTNETRKLFYMMVIGLFGLILMFIPVVNLISWSVIAAWLLAVEYLSYPLENHGATLRQVRRRLRGSYLLSMGFGVAVMLATLIPGVNLFVMPAAVAGATALWVDHWRGKI
jgi:CysZ protein